MTNSANRRGRRSSAEFTQRISALADAVGGVSGLTAREGSGFCQRGEWLLEMKRALEEYGSDMPQRHQINSLETTC